jgi:hypothetical protein
MIEKLLSVAFLVPMGDPNDPACKWGLNVMLWGPPGIGKSERIEAAGLAVGLPVRTTYVPTCQPEDAAGTAFVNTSKGGAVLDALLEGVLEEETPLPVSKNTIFRMKRAAERYGSAFARIEPLLPGVGDLLADGQGVWFLDELSSGRPAVQAGFLGAALARKVGGLQLPPGVRVVAAGNPPECAAGGWDLEPPMANRWCHFELKTPTAEEFSEWLLSEHTKKIEYIEDGEARVKAEWATHWPMVKGQFSGFLQSAPSALHQLPKEGHKDRGRAWPSPRTMVFAMRAITTSRCLGVDEAIEAALVEGCIGEATATMLYAWVKNANLPTPQQVLANGWEPDKKRLDRCIAVYSAMIAYVTSLKVARNAGGIAAWRVLKQSVDAKLLDLTLPCAHALVRAGFDSSAGPEMAEALKPVMLQLAKAGMGKYLPNAV